MDLFQNQMMKCIICHDDTIPLEILATCNRCKKCFIAYHKSNDITTMKNHVKINHFTLLKKLLKDGSNALRFLLDHEPKKRKAHVSPTIIFKFF
jgi:hypothetical protein